MFLFNPLGKTATKETVRQEIVCRIERLQILNRSPVSNQERKGDEYDYLKRYARDWLAAGGNRLLEKNKPNEEFLLDHPRFQELVASERTLRFQLH